MFAVLMNSGEARPQFWPGTESPIPAGARMIAEYSAGFRSCAISVVEVAAEFPFALRELAKRRSVTAVPAGTLEQGLDLARAMFARRGRSISRCRNRSGSW